jgi:membrane carboxypeptidase/penicillin-binding protein
MEFMKAYIDGRADKDTPPEFAAPANIVFLSVDKSTGAVLSGDSGAGVHEAFISGTQPGTPSHQP